MVIGTPSGTARRVSEELDCAEARDAGPAGAAQPQITEPNAVKAPGQN